MLQRCAAMVRGLIFLEELQSVWLSQCVNVCTLLSNNSVSRSVFPPCPYAQMCSGELSGRAQRAEKTRAHDTSQLQYTTKERWRACSPCSANYDPSLTHSVLYLGSHQDIHDLMMRETSLIIPTQQTSSLAVL